MAGTTVAYAQMSTKRIQQGKASTKMAIYVLGIGLRARPGVLILLLYCCTLNVFGHRECLPTRGTIKLSNNSCWPAAFSVAYDKTCQLTGTRAQE